jgi:hypothetical protein
MSAVVVLLGSDSLIGNTTGETDFTGISSFDYKVSVRCLVGMRCVRVSTAS